MSTKQTRNRHSQRRRYRTNSNLRQQAQKRPNRQTPEQIVSNLIEQFNFWCVTLRTKATYEFDNDENNHRCKMTLPIFPNLQSIGNGAKTKKEAKSNAIIAFLAHMEKRKQVGLFVPYIIPNLLRDIQVELRRADVSPPDLNINVHEYLLADRIITKRQAKKNERIMKILGRICDVRVITLWQSSNMTFVYIVGSKIQQDLIAVNSIKMAKPYVKALFQPESEQMFNYGEKLFDIFSDEKFLDDVCQRLKVLCDNHLEECKLFIRGSSVNVQCCYNEFVVLRREFEHEFHRNRKQLMSGTTNLSPIANDCSNQNELKTTTEQLESTRIDAEEKPEINTEEKTSSSDEKETDQLPDYSTYGDDVNASILKVLRNEEDSEEQATTTDQEVTNEKSPSIIEISDDSVDSADLQVLQTIKPEIQKKPDQVQHPTQPLKPRPQPTVEVPSSSRAPVLPPPPVPLSAPARSRPTETRVFRHIVLDGQNIARNSNDYNRSFSWSRLSNAIEYFKKRGHENIIAFLPLYCRDYSNRYSSTNDTREQQIRDNLINLRYIAFTPSRYNNGHRLTNYDDRFILQYAADNDGVVVSNDNFRDLQHERAFQFIINNRILPFATINDTFMPATDPLGRNGPNLDEFLSKKSVM